MYELNSTMKQELEDNEWYCLQRTVQGYEFIKSPVLSNGKIARWGIKSYLYADKNVKFEIAYRKTPLPIYNVKMAMDLQVEFLKIVEKYGYKAM